MKIAVLAGGLSPERDVSLVSGSLVANSLMRSGHRVCLADLYIGLDVKTISDSLFIGKESCREYSHKINEKSPDLEKLVSENGGRRDLVGPGIIELCKMADVTFLALHGGVGEDGRLQAMLDIYGIKYTGSGSSASALAMDKVLTKMIIEKRNIDTAEWMLYDRDSDSTEDVIEKLGLPCVVKPSGCGSSVGVSIAGTEEELKVALRCASEFGKVLIEKRIRGREFSVAVFDGKVLPPIEIIPLKGFYDYENKYQAGCTKEICPPDITQEEDNLLRTSAKKVFDLLGLRSYSRIDFILSDGKAYCLEANTLPGMTPNSLLPQEAAAVGIGYDRLCERIAELALENQTFGG